MDNIESKCEWCGASYVTWAKRRRLCPACVKSQVNEATAKGDLCACGCGQRTKWKGAGPPVVYIRGHAAKALPASRKKADQAARDARRETYKSTCAWCREPYSTRAKRRLLCLKCEHSQTDAESYKGELCACGCGARTKWRQSGSLSKFLPSHHMRMDGANAHRKGVAPANKGIGLRKQNVPCLHCGKTFFTRDPRKRYCDHACFAKSNTGTNHARYNPLRLRRTPLEKQVRQCTMCSDKFTPSNGRQTHCPPCIHTPSRAAPMCACGCEQKVNWQVGKGWRKYLQGHHLKFEDFAVSTDESLPPGVGSDGKIGITCAHCGRKFRSYNLQDKHCGENCRYASGVKKPLKGRNGYVYKRNDNGKMEALHRTVAEKMLDRDLLWHEIVHHIDRNRGNAAPSNLFVFHCQRCHLHHHRTGNMMVYQYKAAHVKNGMAVGVPDMANQKVRKTEANHVVLARDPSSI